MVEMGGNEPKPDTKKMSDEMNSKDIYYTITEHGPEQGLFRSGGLPQGN